MEVLALASRNCSGSVKKKMFLARLHCLSSGPVKNGPVSGETGPAGPETFSAEGSVGSNTTTFCAVWNICCEEFCVTCAGISVNCFIMGCRLIWTHD